MKTIYFNNGPNTNCFIWTYLGKIRNLKVGWPGPPRKECGVPRPMRHPRFRHLWAYVTPSFAGYTFRVISGETWYHLPIHRCSFSFPFNLNYIFVSLCMYNSRIKLLTLISHIKIWCQTWKICLWKDWNEWQSW